MKKPLNVLVSKLTKAEGKKVSVSVGNTRELLSMLRLLCRKEPEQLRALLAYLVK